jgi:two-component system OmpR family sensor kinase
MKVRQRVAGGFHETARANSTGPLAPAVGQPHLNGVDLTEGRGGLLVQTLERLLALPAADLRLTLSQASDIIAAALDADKVDAFLYDQSRDSLVALGTSNQPLSSLQKQHGLDVLQVSNGGRVVHVFKTGETFLNGHLDRDPHELRGVKEALGIRSKLGVPLQVGEARRGMVMIASTQPEHFTAEQARFAEAIVRWVGVVMHRAELVEEITRNAAARGRQAVAEELITVLAHDLRNYISPIHLRLHALRKRAEEEGREADLRDIRLALRGVDRLSGMVSDILDVSRIDEGVLPVNLEIVELAPLLTDVTRAMSTPEHAIELKMSDDLHVDGDPRRIRQCVENLLSNAVKHSPANASVTVFLRRVTRDGRERARVDIMDQGAGIPADVLPRMFDRFVTGEARQGGTGLGLYLARRIAIMHGGDLEVASTPGRGTCFSLILPCHADPAAD